MLSCTRSGYWGFRHSSFRQDHLWWSRRFI